jgi:hypothetical protein
VLPLTTHPKRTLLELGVLGAALLGLAQAWAGPGEHSATFDPDWSATAAARYANLEPEACLAELGRRAIKFERVDEAPGVATPVRVLDGVGGVVYRTALSRARRATSPYDVFDCRLVLALDDLSTILRKHGVDEAIIYSAWRPPPKSWPAGKPTVRHPAAMAVDIGRLGRWATDPSPVKPASVTGPAAAPSARGPEQERSEAATEGTSTAAQPRTREWLDLEKDFGGRIGAELCGPKAPPPEPATAQAREIRAIVCEAAAARIFTSILTPNYNQAHHSHVHADLTPKVRWRILR